MFSGLNDKSPRHPRGLTGHGVCHEIFRRVTSVIHGVVRVLDSR